MDLATATEQFAILAFASLMILAAAHDWRSLTVPNSYSIALVALFPSYVLATGGEVDWPMHLVYAGVAFLIGFVFFAFRFCGGGDVKLFSAAALWAGPELIVFLLFFMAIAGAFMTVVMWVHHRMQRAGSIANFPFVRSDASFAKQPMAYAVAIAAGGLSVALQLLIRV